jgi:hypothetical protein
MPIDRQDNQRRADIEQSPESKDSTITPGVRAYTVIAAGRQCHCPNEGCLEAYVSGWAISERAQAIVESNPSVEKHS